MQDTIEQIIADAESVADKLDAASEYAKSALSLLEEALESMQELEAPQEVIDLLEDAVTEVTELLATII